MTGLAVRQCVVFACLFVGYTMYVVCRKDFAFVIPVIGNSHESLTDEQMGAIVSSQNLAQAISKFVLGVFSDQLDARYMFFVGLCAASGSVLLFASVSSLSLYCVAWALNGVAQGFGWPSEAKLLRQWFAREWLGTVWSLGSASSNVAGSVVPALLPLLLPWLGGWRQFFMFTAGASIVMAFLFLLLVRNSPEECGYAPVNRDGHTDTSTTTNKLNTKSKSGKKVPSVQANEGSAATATWNDMLRSPLLWLLAFYYLVAYAAKICVDNWMQLFLIREKHLSQHLSALFMSSFETGGLLSSILTGYASDWLVAKQPNRASSSSRLDICLLYTCASVILTYLLTQDVLEYLNVLGFAYGFSLYGTINICGLVATEAAPLHLSGSSHAIASLASNGYLLFDDDSLIGIVGAIIAGLPLSVVAGWYSWNVVFEGVCAALLFCVSVMVLTRGSCTHIAHNTHKLKIQ